MKVTIESKGIDELLKNLENVAKNLPREAYAALNAAGNKVRSQMAKEVHRELNVAQKVIREQTSIIKNRATATVTVMLMKSDRIPLKEFKAKQNKKGVRAKISRTRGFKDYKPGFIIVKFGSHAFTRPDNGRKIAKLHGPSPFGVIVKDPDKMTRVMAVSREEVMKAIAKRIRYLELKKAGKLNWQENA